MATFYGFARYYLTPDCGHQWVDFLVEAPVEPPPTVLAAAEEGDRQAMAVVIGCAEEAVIREGTRVGERVAQVIREERA